MISVRIIELLRIHNQNKYLLVVSELKEVEKEYELIVGKYEDKLVQWRRINGECLSIVSRLDEKANELRVKDFLINFICLRRVKGIANKYQEELDYLLCIINEIRQRIDDLRDKLAEAIYEQKGLEALKERVTNIKVKKLKKMYQKVLSDINNLDYFIRDKQ